MSAIDYLKDRRILVLVAIVVLLLAADLYYGIHLGIEFSGGTEIPITLQHSVNPGTMSALLATLQQRISTFGLKEVTIEGIGNSAVYLIIPTVNQNDINSTVSIIEQQGIFQGIVNGREAINGSDILGGSGGIQPSYSVSGSNVTWLVNFYITQESARSFAKVVYGQANKPLYMFLDRPTNTVVLLNSSLITGQGISIASAIQAFSSAMELGNQTVPVEILDNGTAGWSSVRQFFVNNRGKYKTVILANSTPVSIIRNLTSLNYTVSQKTQQQMLPSFTSGTNTSVSVVLDAWPAVGLLSAPILSAGVTNGNIGEAYVVSGNAPNGSTVSERILSANNESTTIASVLSGGALPVSVIVGVPFSTPATLGQHFEVISIIALLLAILAVAVTIAIRYKRRFLILPIVLTTVAELFIIGSIIGTIGTIDLPAVAGMIAVIGTGVDAQIIISDEVIVGSGESSIKSKLNHAFYIVWADAILLIIAMLPLLFSSSLVTVIGFAESTILGALFGALITRPAYGAILSRHFSKGGAS